MKLYTFEVQKQQKVGVERDGKLIETPYASMLDLINAGRNGLAAAKKAAGAAHDLKKAKILAPIPRPGKIWCSGLNYRSHIEENPGAKMLDDPRFFAKFPDNVIGPKQPIKYPGEKYQMDYEVELAVVIGKTLKQGSGEDAIMDAVFGYTILHDVSARWMQFKDANEMLGKNFDTFAPMGPCLVTKDEIPDPSKLHLSLKLNGQVMQDGTNEDWCFPLPRLIAWLTQAITLYPGDVISTGTPAGVGLFRKPQVWLKPGDVCELAISGIGTLINPVK
ncbi:MAG: fumarylacetoacetate hydrolase family protein [Caldilineaceae bacterium]|jgi:2-keto-4-pentenoate hydratase/2-oxohepta-3-ene-1,7-dioic acid hydratase in catechol pathway